MVINGNKKIPTWLNINRIFKCQIFPSSTPPQTMHVFNSRNNPRFLKITVKCWNVMNLGEKSA